MWEQLHSRGYVCIAHDEILNYTLRTYKFGLPHISTTHTVGRPAPYVEMGSLTDWLPRGTLSRLSPTKQIKLLLVLFWNRQPNDGKWSQCSGFFGVWCRETLGGHRGEGSVQVLAVAVGAEGKDSLLHCRQSVFHAVTLATTSSVPVIISLCFAGSILLKCFNPRSGSLLSFAHFAASVFRSGIL